MRYTLAAAVLSMFVAVVSSAGLASGNDPDPRAQALVAEGRSSLASGDTQAAIDLFEAALAVDPGYAAVYVDLGDAARADGMQGKAIRYYREALERAPDDLAAILGEGEALAEKGALETARENLARLEELCGANCGEVLELSAAIDRGALPRLMTAEAVDPDAGVTVN